MNEIIPLRMLDGCFWASMVRGPIGSGHCGWNGSGRAVDSAGLAGELRISVDPSDDRRFAQTRWKPGRVRRKKFGVRCESGLTGAGSLVWSPTRREWRPCSLIVWFQLGMKARREKRRKKILLRNGFDSGKAKIELCVIRQDIWVNTKVNLTGLDRRKPVRP